MKNIRIIFSMLVLMALGLGSCDDELAQPPVTIPEGGIGNGTWDSPAGVFQVINGFNNTKLDGCWVHGYIVGTVNTSDATGYVLKDATADFRVPTTVNSNLMLAYTPDETDWRNCMTVQIQGSVRDALNLKDHPENLGKEVCIKGSLDEKYFGAYALKSTTAYRWGDKGIEGDDNVKPEGVAVVNWDFLNKENGFTFDQKSPDTSVAQIWKITEKYGWVSSGFISGSCIASESTLISPVIDLTNYTEVTMNVHSAANKFNDQATFLAMTMVMVREEGATSWTQVEMPNAPDGNSWDFSDTGEIDLSAFDGKKIQIGFYYTSSTSVAGSWEIDKLQVYGKFK